jgi:hypothetical protein
MAMWIESYLKTMFLVRPRRGFFAAIEQKNPSDGTSLGCASLRAASGRLLHSN